MVGFLAVWYFDTGTYQKAYYANAVLVRTITQLYVRTDTSTQTCRGRGCSSPAAPLDARMPNDDPTTYQ